jgi:[ribosomal protein S5]-alanine N-acetyltransferase
VELIRLDGDLLEALTDDPKSALRGPWSNPEVAAQYLPQIADATRALYEKRGNEFPWIGYLARREDNQALVGTCAFATPPNDENEAEIAYYTFPPYEGAGHGMAMAAALIDIAREGDLDSLTAKTLPQENVSTRILRKLSFDLEGPIVDEEDGDVWLWRLTL